MNYDVSIPNDFKTNGEVIIRALFEGEGYDWGGMMLYLDRVHAQGFTGLGVNIVVLDTGYHRKHPDLDDDVERANFIPNETVYDYHGHGTHVRGIINMQRNGAGLIGVAPDAKCHIGKVLNKYGGGSSESLTRGFEWALGLKPDVINLSLAAAKELPALKELIEEAENMGVLVVGASGNAGKKAVAWPARENTVIATGAIDQRENITSFSNTGANIHELQVVAPGKSIRSTWNNNNYKRSDGTSMACPHVTGLAAIIIQWYAETYGEKPDNDEVKRILFSSCVDLGKKGDDVIFGHGRISTNFIDYKEVVPAHIKKRGCNLFKF